MSGVIPASETRCAAAASVGITARRTQGPLEGVKVLELGAFLAGPFAGTLLAEMGAEVVKVEHPMRPDGLRKTGVSEAQRQGNGYLWAQEGRNKKFITVDLKSTEGQQIIGKLVQSGFDTVIENFVPGTLARWGLDDSFFTALSPRTIIAHVSGYGQDGPRAHLPGFARIAHAYAGLTYLCGEPSGPPLTPGSTTLADYITGMFTAIGILAAGKERESSGLGQAIDVSLFESVHRLMDSLTVNFSVTGTARQPVGLYTPLVAPHGQFPTRNDTWIALACSTDDQFSGFCKAVGRTDLLSRDDYNSVSARNENGAAINREVCEITSAFDRDELLMKLDAERVPAGPVNSIADIFDDPQYWARDALVNWVDPEWGSMTLPGIVPKLSRTPGQLRTLGALEPGRDNDSVLAGVLHLGPSEIAGFRARGVI